MTTLKVGDESINSQVTVLAEDSLCYQILSKNRGATGIRTISKALLAEFVNYLSLNPDAKPKEIRKALSGNSPIDKYEYGYDSTLWMMAKMILEAEVYLM